MTPEAAKLHTEIADDKKQIDVLSAKIQQREGKLRRIAADAFSAESEPIDGITAEPGEIILGSKSCEVSPIGDCVYSHSAISLPAQRRTADSSATHWDACLFCGIQDRVK